MTPRERWAALAVDVLPLALAAWLTARILPVWLERMTYPYDLEWMEGGMLAHAWRLARGLPLYGEPSPDWVPYIYPPGYSAILAALGGPDGLSYGLGRFVSIAGTLAAAAAIVRVAQLAGRGGVVPGLVAAACYLGTYRASGGFFDLVRPDGLAMGLWSWSVAMAVDKRRGSDIASGLLLCAAYLVKHSMAATGIPIAFALLLRDGWRGMVRFVVASALPAALITLQLQLRTDGRFLRYIVEIPRSHPMVWGRIVPGTPGELGVWLLLAILASAGLLLLAFPYRTAGVRWPIVVFPAAVVGALGGARVLSGPLTSEGVPPASVAVLFVACACFVASAVVASMHAGFVLVGGVRAWRWWLAAGVGAMALAVGGLMRGHYGGFMNVLMPVHWSLCAGLAVAAVTLRAWWPGLPVHAATALLLTAQVGLIGRRLDMEAIVPDQEDRDAIAGLAEALRKCPEGAILSPHAAWAPVLVGRPPSTHLIAWWDLNHRRSPFHGAIGTMGEAARAHHWSCVLLGGKQPVKLGANGRIDLEASYEALPGVVFPPAMRTKTGWRVQPRQILVPRRERR